MTKKKYPTTKQQEFIDSDMAKNLLEAMRAGGHAAKKIEDAEKSITTMLASIGRLVGTLEHSSEDREWLDHLVALSKDLSSLENTLFGSFGASASLASSMCSLKYAPRDQLGVHVDIHDTFPQSWVCHMTKDEIEEMREKHRVEEFAKLRTLELDT